MANIKSAEKRARIAKTRTLRNTSRKSAMKTAVKRFEASLAEQDNEKIEANFKKAIQLIDKAAVKGIIHPNARDRKKAQLAKKLNQAQA
ncbi:MAG TPA: 30S ribosomal protein S20 [Syntrophaceticus sp.]|nr:30S ribosomal protein S20 [Syntrophaceticus schinkii]MDD4260920.1 30S ribosomal protein S20 [Syntrophaceticus schinkii]MDD4674260.1 30S ribosomal protein S20 [Syntrophaceticus schinkii]HHY30438.1 30S ribosomal protein S20 [Syntrophaceticus sp.]